MITAGIDIGARTIKVVVLRDGEVIARVIELAGFDTAASAREVMERAVSEAGITRGNIDRVVSTGAGRESAPGSDRSITEVVAAARGAVHLYPDARTVIDVGAEQGRAIRTDGRGRVVDFTLNERCAAGAGVFTEAMARALEVPLAKLGALSLKSTRAVAMNAQCVVFAESDAVAMIHDNVARADVARAVHEAIASRIIAMARRVGYRSPVVLIGGLVRNGGFVDALRRGLEVERIEVPEQPDCCAALGAALAATDCG